jgi:serine/threonine-protein kinase CTR1
MYAITLARDPVRNLYRLQKSMLNPVLNSVYFKREIAIHKQLRHPLIIGFDGCVRYRKDMASIITEFVPNGSLADHLPSALAASSLCLLKGDTKIAIIITGIVIAMRYLHSKGVIHGDLKPGNILLDWDWITRLSDFSQSKWVNESDDEFDDMSRESVSHKRITNSHYSAPEIYYDICTQKSDVFSFGLILYEVIVGEAAFSRNLTGYQVMKKVVLEKTRPVIPSYVLRPVRDLIDICLDDDPDIRPSFDSILRSLEEIEFRITPRVNTKRVADFVEEIQRLEYIYC